MTNVNARVVSGLARFDGDSNAQPMSSANARVDDISATPITPELLEALRRIAPQRRRSKLPYVIGLALLTFGVALGRSGVTRNLLGRWRAAAAHTAEPRSEPVDTIAAAAASTTRAPGSASSSAIASSPASAASTTPALITPPLPTATTTPTRARRDHPARRITTVKH